MSDYLSSIILGVIQGVAEFLPISSSGHLVIFQKFLTIKNIDNLFIDVMLHFGTLLAILVYFRKKLYQLLTAFFKELFSSKKYTEKMKNSEFSLGMYIIIGSIPTAIIGLKFKDYFENMYSDIGHVGIFLMITGIILLIPSFIKTKNKDIDYKRALLIGFFQGLAITPGISRSGITISTATMTGVEQKKSADYSFLLSIPAVAGATLLQFLKVYKHGIGSISILPVIIGAVVAFIVGLIAMHIVYKMISNKKFHYFAFYCIIAGALTYKFLS